MGKMKHLFEFFSLNFANFTGRKTMMESYLKVFLAIVFLGVLQWYLEQLLGLHETILGII